MKRKIALLLWSMIMLQGFHPLFAQNLQVSGTVTSSVTRLPLAGATVTIKGTNTGVATDANGNFSISVPKTGSILQISYIGMAAIEVPVTDAGPMAISMLDLPGSLNELVVTGYGQQRRNQVTGAISSVKADQLRSVSNTRIEQALQGRTSGVQVIPISGQPGSGISVRIRGTGSNGNSNPLVIVDGVRVGGLESLDPSEVASIDILKDAASAAIYGAEGANGVLIITTKTGRKNSSQITYSGQYGTQSVKDGFVKMMNAQQYQQYLQEAGVAGRPTPADVANIGEGTDWMKETTQTAPQQHHSLSFSGGTEKSTYLVAGNIFTQDGIVGGDKARFNRYTFRLNTDNQVKSWLNLGNRFVYSHHRRKAISENNEFGSILGSALVMDPITPVHYNGNTNLPAHVQNAINSGKPLRVDANGNIYGLSQFLKGEYGNPLARIDMAEGENVQNKIIGSIYAEVQPFDGFKFTSKLGLDAAFQTGHGWTPTFYFSDESQNTIANGYDYSNNWFTWQVENFATYQFKTGDHNFEILGGVSAQKLTETHMGGSFSGLFKEEEKFSYADFVPDAQDRIGSISFNKTLASFYGRLSYDYKNKYLLRANLRRDGSSLFASDYQWGTFPSVAVGWIFTNEDFMSSTNFLNYGKLRVSWGQNGSLSNIGLGEWQNSISAGLIYPDGSGGLLVGAAPTSLAYPQLTWETSEQLNIGADFAFFSNRMNVSVDYFKKTTKDLLTPGNAPLFAGNILRRVNAGNVENKGIEIELGYQSPSSKSNGFTYGISVNYTHIKNNVTYLDPNSPILFGAGIGTGWSATAMQVGNPLWYFNGYKTGGIFQSQEEIDAYIAKTGITGYSPKPGEPIVVDVNGDKAISPADMTNIGSPHPDHMFGARLTMGWKGFDFLVFAQGQQGNEMLMGFNRGDRSTANKPEFFYNNRWTGEGSTNTWFAANTGNPYIYNGDLMVFDGSYVRIRQLQLGYTLPKNLTDNLKISNLRIYFTLDDFFTFTKYPGVDPESGNNGGNSMGIDRGGYPIPRKALAGISLTF